MACYGCVFYKYESDTNFAYCQKEHEVLEECGDYYSVELWDVGR